MRRTVIATLLALLTAAPAAQASGDDVLRDCFHDGRLNRTYTQAEYREALRNMPADADEYSNCRQVIRRAMERALAGGGASQRFGLPGVGGGIGDGGIPLDEFGLAEDPIALATDEERAAVDRRRQGRFDRQRPNVAPADRLDLRAASAGERPDDPSAGLPWQLVALIGMVGVAGAAGAAGGGRSLIARVRSGRPF